MLRSQLVESLRKMGKDPGHVDTRKEEVWEDPSSGAPCPIEQECCPWIFFGRQGSSPWADFFFFKH